MRRLALLCLLPTGLHAWEFTPGLPCLLTYTGPSAQVQLTYDPTAPLYTITVTRDAPWPATDRFEMAFDGPQARRIGTDRHQFSQDMRSLTVADVGFGNLLDGLEFNATTTAIVGDASVTVPLDGITAPLAAFRACDTAPPVS